MDILSALAGSGPAYFFEFMASLQKAAVSLGFNAKQARILVNQTALGAAAMASASELELADLRAQVTSKGGSTAKGIEVYQAADIDFISEQALRAAVLRNKEMAKLF
jgi:pyrroline-5-carboxylate reductase